MKQLTMTVSFMFFFALILWFFATLATAQEVEFSYIRGSPNGPERWGELRPEWSQCSRGRLQSPINLPLRISTLAPPNQRITTSYNPANATLVNSGHDIAVEWRDENSKITINGTEYILREVHWHTPSEHTIIGIRFAMEAHLVHRSAANQTAVIGVLYVLGLPDPFLSMLTEKIQAVSNGTIRQVDAGVVDPRDIRLRRNNILNPYYRYMGSLTTPPCTENVVWTVIRKPKTVSRSQVALLQNAVDDDAFNNARPIQLTNDRPVMLYFDSLA